MLNVFECLLHMSCINKYFDLTSRTWDKHPPTAVKNALWILQWLSWISSNDRVVIHSCIMAQFVLPLILHITDLSEDLTYCRISLYTASQHIYILNLEGLSQCPLPLAKIPPPEYEPQHHFSFHLTHHIFWPDTIPLIQKCEKTVHIGRIYHMPVGREVLAHTNNIIHT